MSDKEQEIRNIKIEIAWHEHIIKNRRARLTELQAGENQSNGPERT